MDIYDLSKHTPTLNYIKVCRQRDVANGLFWLTISLFLITFGYFNFAYVHVITATTPTSAVSFMDVFIGFLSVIAIIGAIPSFITGFNYIFEDYTKELDAASAGKFIELYTTNENIKLYRSNVLNQGRRISMYDYKICVEIDSSKELVEIYSSSQETPIS